MVGEDLVAPLSREEFLGEVSEVRGDAFLLNFTEASPAVGLEAGRQHNDREVGGDRFGVMVVAGNGCDKRLDRLAGCPPSLNRGGSQHELPSVEEGDVDDLDPFVAQDNDASIGRDTSWRVVGTPSAARLAPTRSF